MQTFHEGKLVPTLLTVIDKKSHTLLRKPINNIFSMNTVARFEPLVDGILINMIKVLKERFADERQTCDIDHWLQYRE